MATICVSVYCLHKNVKLTIKLKLTTFASPNASVSIEFKRHVKII